MHEEYSITNQPKDSTPDLPITFHPKDYYSYIEDLDLNEDQKNELLQMLWNIMATFVDIGWGVDTVQIMLPELFDQSSESKLAPDSKDALDSSDTKKQTTDSTNTGGT